MCWELPYTLKSSDTAVAPSRIPQMILQEMTRIMRRTTIPTQMRRVDPSPMAPGMLPRKQSIQESLSPVAVFNSWLSPRPAAHWARGVAPEKASLLVATQATSPEMFFG